MLTTLAIYTHTHTRGIETNKLALLEIDWIDAVHVPALPPIRICVNESVRFHRDSANDGSASVLPASYIVSPGRHVVDNVLIRQMQMIF